MDLLYFCAGISGIRDLDTVSLINLEQEQSMNNIQKFLDNIKSFFKEKRNIAVCVAALMLILAAGVTAFVVHNRNKGKNAELSAAADGIKETVTQTQETQTESQTQETETPELTLISLETVSEEDSITVNIVDENRKTVKGQDFVVNLMTGSKKDNEKNIKTVQEAGDDIAQQEEKAKEIDAQTYSDKDMDGSVVIKDLSVGTYTVVLCQREGFALPDAAEATVVKYEVEQDILDKVEEQNEENAKEDMVQRPQEDNSEGGVIAPIKPSEKPTEVPTEKPLEKPTEKPTDTPTEPGTENPGEIPSEPSTDAPTQAPAEPPTKPETTHDGWVEIAGDMYYYENGTACTGWKQIEGIQYYFDGDGILSSELVIDVSTFQGTIDWDKVKASGIEYAMIRVGYRGYGSGKLVKDEQFERNIKEASRVGIKIGAYVFTQAINTQEAVEEASFIVKAVEGYNISLPLAIDVEYANGGNGRGDKHTPSERTAIINAFAKTVADAGYTPMVYASKSWLTDYIDTPNITGICKIWVAQYNDTCTYKGHFDMWQFTSKGSVSGIRGNVDVSAMKKGFLRTLRNGEN